MEKVIAKADWCRQKKRCLTGYEIRKIVVGYKPKAFTEDSWSGPSRMMQAAKRWKAVKARKAAALRKARELATS
jgi:hypothetical protein